MITLLRSNKRRSFASIIGHQKWFGHCPFDGSLCKSGDKPWTAEFNLRFTEMVKGKEGNENVEYIVHFDNPEEALRFGEKMVVAARRQLDDLDKKRAAGEPVTSYT